MRWRWILATGLAFSSCADQAEEDGGARDAGPRVTRDAGARDGALPPLDGAPDDGGLPAGDGAVPDGGTPADDATAPDGGPPAPDGGQSANDGGPPGDGDVPPPDGGALPPDGAPPAGCEGVVCDDRNPCTTDTCDGGRCVFAPAGAGTACGDGDPCNGAETCDGSGACNAGAPVVCRSDDPCLAASCDPVSGRCRVARIAGCCAEDDECVSGDVCLDARCDPGRRQCAEERNPDCCRADADCGPAGACVEAFCDPATARCATRPVADCCARDADCPEVDGCTAFACDRGACVERPVAGCCVTDVDCGGAQGCENARCRPLADLDRDDDGAPADVDCDDRDPARFPGHPEVCEGGVDEDCDAQADDADPECAPPPPAVDFAAIQFPLEPLAGCAGGPSALVFGRVFAAGRTPGEGQGRGVEAELGFGPDGSDPTAGGWLWIPGTYNADLRNEFDQLNDDEYRANLALVPAGEWDVAWRFRLDGGPWTYADKRPGGSGDGYDPAQSLALVAREDCPPVGFAATQFPVQPITVCGGELPPDIFGRVWVAGRTPGEGRAIGIDAELGYGPDGSDPAGPGWDWVRSEYNGDLRNGFNELSDDEYRGALRGVGVGTWDVAWRFRADGGPWTYGDLVPQGSTDGYAPAAALSLTVRAACD